MKVSKKSIKINPKPYRYQTNTESSQSTHQTKIKSTIKCTRKLETTLIQLLKTSENSIKINQNHIGIKQSSNRVKTRIKQTLK